ncbi:MAG TPA: hypothetical protein VF543_03125 [Pyrinomonadaceae bacterium]|jgi:hypothetical protein
MKLVLSRKGFDSSAGCVPSPILPDGTLLSLPIPDESQTSKIRYEDINVKGKSIGKIVEDLTKKRITRRDFAHLDPDLRPSSYPRLPNWRPLFGQTDQAQTHLKNEGVTIGDLFLFFGWFRKVEFLDGKYRFVRKTPDLHVIYGWLQIGTILSVEKNSYVPPWAKYHHHFHPPPNWRNNAVYVSSENLTLNSQEKIGGAGAFEKYRDELCLTCTNQANRSLWKLPKWFYPSNNLPPLSYHLSKSRWKLNGNHATLRTVGRGQEFVLDADKYPEAIT